MRAAARCCTEPTICLVRQRPPPPTMPAPVLDHPGPPLRTPSKCSKMADLEKASPLAPGRRMPYCRVTPSVLLRLPPTRSPPTAGARAHASPAPQRVHLVSLAETYSRCTPAPPASATWCSAAGPQGGAGCAWVWAFWDGAGARDGEHMARSGGRARVSFCSALWHACLELERANGSVWPWCCRQAIVYGATEAS